MMSDARLSLPAQTLSRAVTLQDFEGVSREALRKFDALGEQIVQQTGVKLQHIPFKGAAEVVSNVLSGQVKFTIDPPGVHVPHVKSGKVVAVDEEEDAPKRGQVVDFMEALKRSLKGDSAKTTREALEQDNAPEPAPHAKTTTPKATARKGSRKAPAAKAKAPAKKRKAG